MFLRRNIELVVEGVVPDLLHVVPVGNYSWEMRQKSDRMKLQKGKQTSKKKNTMNR
jgi:hypothetical protein